MHKSYLQKVEDYVLSILTERTPVQNTYHNPAHTKDVVSSSIEIGTAENLSQDEMEIIQIAAWFHDVGYIDKSESHEELSAMYASNFLTEENYPADKIDLIIGCILATKVPQNPKNKLEKIICDSDLNHIGRNTFFERNDLFRLEYENQMKRRLTEYEWMTKTIDFITRHLFFTDYALKNFSGQKKENLRVLQEQLDQIINRSN
jgi:predicted metal-dependent HD superfamily phosphohydrolase